MESGGQLGRFQYFAAVDGPVHVRVRVSRSLTACAHDLKMSIEWENCWIAQGHSPPLLGKTNACPHSWSPV